VVEDVIGDLHDGTILAELLEILTGKTCFDCPFFHFYFVLNVLYSLYLTFTTGDKVGKLKHGEMRIQHLANLSTVFKFLQNYVKLVDIGPQDVLDGNEVRILGLLWSIISVFSLRSMNTNMPGCRHMGDLKQRLLAWAQVWSQLL
jgi:hypothetical protein